jgi:hypothetical protein
MLLLLLLQLLLLHPLVYHAWGILKLSLPARGTHLDSLVILTVIFFLANDETEAAAHGQSVPLAKGFDTWFAAEAQNVWSNAARGTDAANAAGPQEA